ncbi:hypothetical protein [Deinococcus sp.]|uniref:hypothetical protein n=1 Tax=Deinococcus sp. TaxID=47478 RepID=UPI003B5C3F78
MPQTLPTADSQLQHAAESVQTRLKHNPAAARAYHALRQDYARQVIQSARARLMGETTEPQDAERASVRRAAHALLLGLAVQMGAAPAAASRAADQQVAQAFNTNALLSGPGSEPHAVYVDEVPAEPRHAAWTLCRGQGLTAYLLSPSEHRRLMQDTGRCPRVLF